MFCKPAAVAPAVVRRDGRVQAAGHPADQARLGLAEERLDELCGSPGVIDEIAGSVLLEGRVKGAARRGASCGDHGVELIGGLPAGADLHAGDERSRRSGA